MFLNPSSFVKCMVVRSMVLKTDRVVLLVSHCCSFLSKINGLMFKRVLPRNQALLIPSESARIHTFFMRFSIDVFWLDKDLRVVDLERNVRPWRPLICPRKKASYILEVPSVYKYNIKLNDRFHIAHRPRKS